MNDFIIYTACPVCGQQHISKVLTAKDFTVSSEYFDIFHCNDCTARFTQHAPQGNNAMRYYESVNYISHSDTRKGIINKLYHAVRKKTLRSKKALIISHTKNKKTLLDIGAGTGAFAFVMQQHGWAVTGIEPDEGARKLALEKYRLLLKSPETFYSLPAESFDAITLWHVLEHVQDLHEYIHYFKKILKPGGTIFIAVPNYTSFDAALYREYWAAYDVPRHLYHFSPQSILYTF